ncbi:hypothetical protein LJC60_08025 [Ruminococcaceae bacterium OttesenSCG-928-D13]|nr:hypothetical protein [Ruminococcaceae bacterium OttesenSCG-928-D13]
MENNRRWNHVFIALFFAMLVLPFPLWMALRSGLDTENRENRELAAFPAPGTATLEEAPAAFEDWLGDHAPFRNQLMTLNAAANWKLFGTVESTVVLPGREGWMFYRNTEDSASLDDYQGLNLYSDAEMSEIAANLVALQENLASQGTDLVLLLAPNKELVYRRYMPKDIPMVNPESRADRLVAYLGQNTDLKVVWPEAELRALSETQPVYYKYDTHWNEAGAAVAAALLLEAAGVEAPKAGALAFEPSDTPPLRDLANLSATWKLAGQDESWRAANWLPGVQTERTEADENGWYERYVSGSANGGKLLMFRDSFGEAMREPLAAAFGESVFVHINGFGEDTIAEEQPDLFVLEITQRYSDRLLDYLPRLVEWTGR